MHANGTTHQVQRSTHITRHSRSAAVRAAPFIGVAAVPCSKMHYTHSGRKIRTQHQTQGPLPARRKGGEKEEKKRPTDTTDTTHVPRW